MKKRRYISPKSQVLETETGHLLAASGGSSSSSSKTLQMNSNEADGIGEEEQLL